MENTETVVVNENAKPKKNKAFPIRNMVFCGMFAALIAVGAFIKIPIPNMPITLQFFFVTLAGLLLGSKYGGLSVAVYIAVGLIGIPVFTAGGGIGYVLYPTFGYLLGFMAAAFVSGLIVEKRKVKNVTTYLIAAFANFFVIYAVGMTYYYLLSYFYLGNKVGVIASIAHSLVIAVPGDIVLCVLCAFMAKRLRPLLHLD